MKNLQIINSETLKRITSKRSGETKFFEHNNYLSIQSERFAFDAWRF